MLLFGLVFGLLAEYFQWVFWIFAESKQQFLTFSPNEILAIIQFAAETGVWSIKSITPTGIFLYLIWFVEAAMIAGISTFTAGVFLKGDPFCEKCEAWVNNSTMLKHLNCSKNDEDLKNRLEQGEFSALAELGKTDFGTNFYTTVELQSCQQCNDFYVMTVKSVSVTKTSKGEDKKTEKSVVENLIINSEVFNSLVQWNNIKEPQTTSI